MRVAVVGAGLAGLAAARELRAAGHGAVVFEKRLGLCGRLAARRAEGTVLDHGSRPSPPLRARPCGRWPAPRRSTTALTSTTASPTARGRRGCLG